MQFNEIQLSGEMLKAIDQIGYTDMTEIQEKSIPVILSGRDIIGRSNTCLLYTSPSPRDTR